MIRTHHFTGLVAQHIGGHLIFISSCPGPVEHTCDECQNMALDQDNAHYLRYQQSPVASLE